MFEFTTQTVYNSVIKAEVADIRDGSATKGYNLVVLGENDTENPEVRIGNTRFNKADVLDIQKKVHTPENLAKVEFDVSELITLIVGDDETEDKKVGDYRIALYLGLSMNSQDSFYSNALLYKGKPFYVEFHIGASDTAATVAKRIKKIADKFMLFMAQEKILTVNVKSSSKVVFEGVNGYQQIKKFVVQKFDPEAVSLGCCDAHGEYIDVMVGVPLSWKIKNGAIDVDKTTLDDGELRALEDNEVGIEPGIEAFCDYNWLIHNLRLPTLANTNFWAITKNEMPVVGGVYNQYIIRICKERDGIAGEVVGQRAKSVTTHVLYVLDDSGTNGTNISTIEDALGSLIDSSMKTDADTVLADPFAPVRESEGGNGGNEGGNVGGGGN